jgi:hypothetical protein
MLKIPPHVLYHRIEPFIATFFVEVAHEWDCHPPCAAADVEHLVSRSQTAEVDEMPEELTANCVEIAVANKCYTSRRTIFTPMVPEPVREIGGKVKNTPHPRTQDWRERASRMIL